MREADRDRDFERLLRTHAAALATAAAAAILAWWGRRERLRADWLAEMQRALQSNGDNGHV